jgi:hypothetical protein
MKTRQITVGFDDSIDVFQVAAVLAKAFGNVTVGQGIQANGLPSGYIFVENKRRQKKNG